MSKLIYVPVRAAVLEQLRFLAEGPAAVSRREHGELTSELVMIDGREQVWITVEPHQRARDLTVEQLDIITLGTAELLAAGLTHLATTRARPAGPLAQRADPDKATGADPDEATARWPRLPAQLAYVVHHYAHLTAPEGVHELDELEERARRAAGMLILLGWSTWPDVFQPATVVSLWNRISRAGLFVCPRDNLRVCADLWEQAALHNFDPQFVCILQNGLRANEALHAAAAWLHAHPTQLAQCAETTR